MRLLFYFASMTICNSKLLQSNCSLLFETVHINGKPQPILRTNVEVRPIASAGAVAKNSPEIVLFKEGNQLKGFEMSDFK